MKKQLWYAITCKINNGAETIVGFSQALIFNRKIQAESVCKENGYKKYWKRHDKENICMKVNVNVLKTVEGCEEESHHQVERGYLYTCKECFEDEKDRAEPYEYRKADGTIGDKFDTPVWCKCPANCGHNIYTCTLCWKPVAIKNGSYWYHTYKSTNPH